MASTVNYGWIKPNVAGDGDAWGNEINTDLDGIDSVVKSVSNSVPVASGANPLMDGSVTPGSSAAFARGDHVHPTDTSRYAASNPSNYQTAVQVTSSLAPYALSSAVPAASVTLPVMDGAATVGTGTTFARADHVHPSDTSKYDASNPSNYQTATQITSTLAPYALTVNVPVASSTTPVMDGTAAVGGGITWARSDHVHPTDTSLLPKTGGTVTGNLGVNGTLTEGTGSGAAQIFANGGAGSIRGLYGQTNGSNRWAIQVGDSVAEGGSNAGSNFNINRFNDSGTLIDTPFSINRSTGAATVAGSITMGLASSIVFSGAGGIKYGAGGTPVAFLVSGNTLSPVINGSATSNAIQSRNQGSPYTIVVDTLAVNNTGNAAAVWNGGTGYIWTVGASDRRLKSSIRNTAKDALAALNKLKVCEFDLKMPGTDKAKHWNWGLMADDELEEVIPSSVHPAAETKAGIIYASLNEFALIGALVKAVQQLTARVEELEAARG